MEASEQKALQHVNGSSEIPAIHGKASRDGLPLATLCFCRPGAKRHLGDSNPCGQSPMDFESISLAARTKCLAVGATATTLAYPLAFSEKNTCQKAHHKQGATLFAPKHMTRTVGFPLPVVEARGVATVSTARLARSCGCPCFPHSLEFEPL